MVRDVVRRMHRGNYHACMCMYIYVYIYIYILRLRPCRRPLWRSQASWLSAWWLGNILIGLLACWVLLSGFCFASTLCWSVCWLVGFWMLVSMPLCWYLQLPRYSPGVTRCFKTSGSDRFGGLLVSPRWRHHQSPPAELDRRSPCQYCHEVCNPLECDSEMMVITMDSGADASM